MAERTVEFRLLGPVEIWVAGRRFDPGPRQQRMVLAALLVDAGRPVMLDSLVNRLWDDEPPRGARQVLYTLVTRIRQLLVRTGLAADGVWVTRRSGGYVLDVEPLWVDIHVFWHLLRRSRDSASRMPQQAALLKEALALWRGEPLAGVPGQWATRTRNGWQQQRLDAAVAWADAERDLGVPGKVIGSLTDLVAEYPLVEPLTEALMRALHGAGRTADALDCYRKASGRLRDELGIDPGVGLRQAHQAILRPEPPEPLPTTGAPQPETAAVPALLPLDTYGFEGRDAELAALDGMLATSGESPRAVLAILSGTAGVGKTALAVRWAHRVRNQFPDGQLYADLRGFGPGATATDPQEVVRTFLHALGVAGDGIPDGTEAQTGLFRALTDGRRILVVLDNARDADQVRPLLPGSPTIMVLVTSRHRLTSLVTTTGARPVLVDLLPTVEARRLLARRIGDPRVAAEPGAVEEMVRRCSRLPLALAIVAARAASYPEVSLTALTSELRDGGGLDALTAGDAVTTIRTVFHWSYHRLSHGAARLFRLLAVAPGPDIAAPAIASLAGTSPESARSALTELTDGHLLTVRRPGRYSCHDLLRAYATELAGTVDSEADRSAAMRRVLDHYLHTAMAAVHLLNPYRDRIGIGVPHAGVTPEDLGDPSRAMAWFAAERPVLLALVVRATETGFDAHAWQLAWTLTTYLGRRGHWHDWVAAQQVALAAAERAGDRHGQAHTHRGLGRAQLQLGHHADAQRHLECAVDHFRAVGDSVGEGHVHLQFGLLHERRHRYRDGLRETRAALRLFRAVGHQPGHADALNAIGWNHALLGDYDAAVRYCGRALPLLEALNDINGQAATLDSLGYAHRHRGDHQEAIACIRRSIDLWRLVGDRYYEAQTLIHLGDTCLAIDEPTAARESWLAAQRILGELNHADSERARTRLRNLNQGG